MKKTKPKTQFFFPFWSLVSSQWGLDPVSGWVRGKNAAMKQISLGAGSGRHFPPHIFYILWSRLEKWGLPVTSKSPTLLHFSNSISVWCVKCSDGGCRVSQRHENRRTSGRVSGYWPSYSLLLLLGVDGVLWMIQRLNKLWFVAMPAPLVMSQHKRFSCSTAAVSYSSKCPK